MLLNDILAGVQTAHARLIVRSRMASFAFAKLERTTHLVNNTCRISVVLILINNLRVPVRCSAVQRRLNFFLQCGKVVLQHFIKVYKFAVYVVYDFKPHFLLCKENHRTACERFAV